MANPWRGEVALVIDGQIVAAAQEERFSRKKQRANAGKARTVQPRQ